MSKFNRPKLTSLVIAAIFTVGLTAVISPTAQAVSPATFTTTADGSKVNANHYSDKCAVYLNGGPTNASLPDGTYVFFVLAPSGQADPNGPGLLSNDSNANRTFTVSGGVVSYAGTHATGTDSVTQALLLQLCLPSNPDEGYANTPNPGGVYIAAICQASNQTPSGCKYDMFKVPPTDQVGGDDLVAVKTATPVYDRNFTWDVSKQVDKTYFQASSGSGTFGYTVGATKSAAVDSNWALTGSIQVFNSNDTAVTGLSVSDDVQGFSDESCTVNTGGVTTIDAGSSVTFTYSCSLPSASAASANDNVANISWDQASVNSPNGSTTATAPFDFASATPTVVGNCTPVTDTLDGVTTTLASSTCSSATYTYSRTIALPSTGCVDHTNTAAVTGDTANATVTLCKLNDGGHTIGFWQNKNGQAAIKTNGTALCSALSAYGNVLSLPAPCTGTSLANYVTTVINLANSSGDGVAMFRAQFLGTALGVNVYGSGGQHVVVPGSLLGTGNCLTVNQLLSAANAKFSVLKLNKTNLLTVKDTFDAFNNNALLTC